MCMGTDPDGVVPYLCTPSTLYRHDNPVYSAPPRLYDCDHKLQGVVQRMEIIRECAIRVQMHWTERLDIITVPSLLIP